jgi:hypothetical protein
VKITGSVRFFGKTGIAGSLIFKKNEGILIEYGKEVSDFFAQKN